MRAKRWLVVVTLLAALAVSAVPAYAEWFGDLYLGGAFTQNSDLWIIQAASRRNGLRCDG
jgi:hypothetical protein